MHLFNVKQLKFRLYCQFKGFVFVFVFVLIIPQLVEHRKSDA